MKTTRVESKIESLCGYVADDITKRQKKLYKFIKSEHRGQQRFDGEDYVNHLIRVGEMALIYNVEFGREIGWLHDIIEDQIQNKKGNQAKADYLNSKLVGFGYAPEEARFIVASVLDLTDKYTKESYPKLNRKARKEKESDRLSYIPSNSQSVKYCDIIDNFSKIKDKKKKFWKVYIREKSDVLLKMNRGNKDLLSKSYRRLMKLLYEVV